MNMLPLPSRRQQSLPFTTAEYRMHYHVNIVYTDKITIHMAISMYQFIVNCYNIIIVKVEYLILNNFHTCFYHC